MDLGIQNCSLHLMRNVCKKSPGSSLHVPFVLAAMGNRAERPGTYSLIHHFEAMHFHYETTHIEIYSL